MSGTDPVCTANLGGSAKSKREETVLSRTLSSLQMGISTLDHSDPSFEQHVRMLLNQVKAVIAYESAQITLLSEAGHAQLWTHAAFERRITWALLGMNSYPGTELEPNFNLTMSEEFKDFSRFEDFTIAVSQSGPMDIFVPRLSKQTLAPLGPTCGCCNAVIGRLGYKEGLRTLPHVVGHRSNDCAIAAHLAILELTFKKEGRWAEIEVMEDLPWDVSAIIMLFKIAVANHKAYERKDYSLD